MVVVLGTGRSGTSMVAGLITALGFDPGPKLIPANRTNPKGHFEDYELWRLKNQVKASRAELELYLRRTDHPRRLIKLPGLADVLPLRFPKWTQFVWAHRALEEAVESSHRAYGRSKTHRRLLTRRYQILAEFFEGHSHLRVEFDEARLDPQATARQVAAWLGVPVTVAAETFIDASSRVSKKNRDR